MVRRTSKIALVLISLLIWLAPAAFAQPAPRSQEISEDDGLPVLVKHLPDWEGVRDSTVFAASSQELKNAVGDRPVLNEIELSGGTEAVKADYPAGRLVIVEFSSPQGSIDADTRILNRLAAAPEPSTVYRRIGNYNVFVFDAKSPEAAIALLDGVKYEKRVQWLGEDPFLGNRVAHYFATTTRDIFVSTVLWIVGGIGLASVLGVIVGLLFFRIRDQQRNTWTRYTDAGGMTRLNLDELSE